MDTAALPSACMYSAAVQYAERNASLENCSSIPSHPWGLEQHGFVTSWPAPPLPLSLGLSQRAQGRLDIIHTLFFRH